MRVETASAAACRTPTQFGLNPDLLTNTVVLMLFGTWLGAYFRAGRQHKLTAADQGPS